MIAIIASLPLASSAFSLGLPALDVGHGAGAVGHAQGSSICEVPRGPAVLLHKVAGFEEATEQEDLGPAHRGHLGERSKTVWNVFERQGGGRRAVPWPLEVLWRDVADAGYHGDAAVLDFCHATAPERIGIPILAVARWIPEAN